MKHDYFKKLDIALRKKFGEPRKCCEEPTAALVRGILSQNTTDKNRDRAFIELRRKFAAWEETLAAEESQIAGAIRVAGMANQRAARIRELLQWLKDNNRGRIDARFLLKMSPCDAMAALKSINGIGAKTAAVFLLFHGDMPFFPVDTHIKRVMVRLGVFPAKTSAEKMIAALSENIPHELHYSLHLNLIELGRAICTARKTNCNECPIQKYCGNSPA